MLVEIGFYENDEDQHLELKMIPAIQTEAKTKWVDSVEQERIFEFMESISVNVEIDENGIVTGKIMME